MFFFHYGNKIRIRVFHDKSHDHHIYMAKIIKLNYIRIKMQENIEFLVNLEQNYRITNQGTILVKKN